MDNGEVTYGGRVEVGRGEVDEAVLVMRFSGAQGNVYEAYRLRELAAVGVNVGKTVVVTVVVALNKSVKSSFNTKKWKLTIQGAERRSRYC
jgi:hypothetical protein